jgi:hypothetical protein
VSIRRTTCFPTENELVVITLEGKITHDLTNDKKNIDSFSKLTSPIEDRCSGFALTQRYAALAR